VRWGCTGMAGEGYSFLAGKGVEVYYGDCQLGSLGLVNMLWERDLGAHGGVWEVLLYGETVDEHNVIIDSLDMSYDREQIDQNDDDNDLANEHLSKSKMMSKSFEALQKHVVNKLDLQQCKEKIKNDKSFKVNQSKDFCKERKQYFEIQDLKAQLQDKGIAISELKKLIEKLNGKSMDTKFEKLLVVRQPNAFKSQRPSILGKPTIFSDSLKRKDFSKSKSVTQNNVSNDFSKPVTAYILPPNKKSILKNTNVLAPGMYKLHTEPTQTRTSQLPHDVRKTNKRVSFSIGVIPTTSVSRPQLKSNPMEDRVMLNNNQGKKKEVEDHRRDVKTKMPIAVPVTTREPKRTIKQSIAKPLRKTVASEPTNQKPRNTFRKSYERVKIILFIVDSGCSKHMTGNLKLLINFVEKFMGTVKFGNDQIAPILGYGDL
nr:integrase, catalytic region, zinc finger, CCHC-type, peptidase aspartic, catalytic [Tanacetum cinerariifolium]